MNKSLIIFGAGGHARVLCEICSLLDRSIAGFLDSAARGSVNGISILGSEELLDDPSFVEEHDFVLGIGKPAIRNRLADFAKDRGVTWATLIHPSAIISQSVMIGEGSVINSSTVINIGTSIGARCIVNTGAIIDHDCNLGDDVQICPGATIAGGVTCANNVFIGSGATLVPGITIGANSTVGAGSTVLDNVPAGVRVFGTPAEIK
jgi:sugar O-acyltransferase (sialic acid O-acetyltransferase NeuD family)